MTMQITTSREQRRQLERDNANSDTSHKQTKLVGIYAITHRESGAVYVGLSSDIDGRWSRHRKDLDGGHHHAVGLQRAWAKHGSSSFEFSVLELCSVEDLRSREAHWIKSFKRTLNSLRPADFSGVLKHDDETRERMSASQIARGYKPSPEHLELMLKRRRETVGWAFSPEARRRMSESAKRKLPPSDITRARLRDANSLRTYKLVRCLTDGEVFKSVADAGRRYGVSNGAICNAIKRTGRSAGHFWEYA